MVPVGLTSRLIGGVDVFHGYRDWSDGLSKVVRRSAVEAVVGRSYCVSEKCSNMPEVRWVMSCGFCSKFRTLSNSAKISKIGQDLTKLQKV